MQPPLSDDAPANKQRSFWKTLAQGLAPVIAIGTTFVVAAFGISAHSRRQAAIDPMPEGRSAAVQFVESDNDGLRRGLDHAADQLDGAGVDEVVLPMLAYDRLRVGTAEGTMEFTRELLRRHLERAQSPQQRGEVLAAAVSGFNANSQLPQAPLVEVMTTGTSVSRNQAMTVVARELEEERLINMAETLIDADPGHAHVFLAAILTREDLPTSILREVRDIAGREFACNRPTYLPVASQAAAQLLMAHPEDTTTPDAMLDRLLDNAKWVVSPPVTDNALC